MSKTCPILDHGQPVSWFKYIQSEMWTQFGDKRVGQLPLFKSGPWTIVSIVSLYLIFVLKLGPKFMRGRKPFDLKRPVFWYNVSLVIVNGYLFFRALFLTNFGIDLWGCQPMATDFDTIESDTQSISRHLGYIFLWSKIFELFDTIIFVLRKKYIQISILHLIHHSLVPMETWIALKLAPGGNAIFFAMINCFIHIFMYGYYAMSIMGSNVTKYLWWKKYLTTFQMLQFIIVLIHNIHVLFLPNCNFPKVVMTMGVFNCILFLILFYSFYNHSYRTKSKVVSKIEICINNNLIKE